MIGTSEENLGRRIFLPRAIVIGIELGTPDAIKASFHDASLFKMERIVCSSTTNSLSSQEHLFSNQETVSHLTSIGFEFSFEQVYFFSCITNPSMYQSDFQQLAWVFTNFTQDRDSTCLRFIFYILLPDNTTPSTISLGQETLRGNGVQERLSRNMFSIQPILIVVQELATENTQFASGLLFATIMCCKVMK